jgi:hypothetical protein
MGLLSERPASGGIHAFSHGILMLSNTVARLPFPAPVRTNPTTKFLQIALF